MANGPRRTRISTRPPEAIRPVDAFEAGQRAVGGGKLQQIWEQMQAERTGQTAAPTPQSVLGRLVGGIQATGPFQRGEQSLSALEQLAEREAQRRSIPNLAGALGFLIDDPKERQVFQEGISSLIETGEARRDRLADLRKEIAGRRQQQLATVSRTLVPGGATEPLTFLKGLAGLEGLEQKGQQTFGKRLENAQKLMGEAGTEALQDPQFLGEVMRETQLPPASLEAVRDRVLEVRPLDDAKKRLENLKAMEFIRRSPEAQGAIDAELKKLDSQLRIKEKKIQAKLDAQEAAKKAKSEQSIDAVSANTLFTAYDRGMRRIEERNQELRQDMLEQIPGLATALKAVETGNLMAITSTLGPMARGISQEVGVLTEKDVGRILTPTLGMLMTRIRAWLRDDPSQPVPEGVRESLKNLINLSMGSMEEIYRARLNTASGLTPPERQAMQKLGASGSDKEYQDFLKGETQAFMSQIGLGRVDVDSLVKQMQKNPEKALNQLGAGAVSDREQAAQLQEVSAAGRKKYLKDFTNRMKQMQKDGTLNEWKKENPETFQVLKSWRGGANSGE